MAPPSEFDLRAALRDGEGDEPDVDQVIVAGAARRAQRRSRILSAAVVIIAVGGLGAGAAEFGGSGGSGSMNSDVAHGAGGALSAAIPAKVNALGDIACPATAPTYAPLSGGGLVGGTGYGSATQLFTGRVSSVVVCAYGATFNTEERSSFAPARLELAGRQAKQVAHSLETAPTVAPSAACSSAPTGQYALIPVDASGNTGRPVTAQVSTTGCGAVVTNGTAVRYGWTPPPDVATKLDELSPSEPPDSAAPAASMTASPTPSPSPTS